MVTIYRSYTYDQAGQLKTATGFEAGGSARVNEKLGYLYDAAGNLNQRTNNALVQTFGVNSRDQLTTATRSGTLTVAGTTTTPATSVSVNGSTAGVSLYADATFAQEGVSLVNGVNTFTAIGTDAYGFHSTNTVTVNLPASVASIYDLNGNLRTNGTRIFEYDDENQLIRVTEPGVWKGEFGYDGMNRRRVETNSTWQSGAFVVTGTLRFN